MKMKKMECVNPILLDALNQVWVCGGCPVCKGEEE